MHNLERPRKRRTPRIHQVIRLSRAVEGLSALLGRILVAFAVLLGGTAFIFYVLLNVLGDLLQRQGALSMDALASNAGLSTETQYDEEELPSAEGLYSAQGRHPSGVIT